MFHTKNLTLIINILLDNDYLLTFIFDTVNQKIINKKIYKKIYLKINIVYKDLIDNVCANESASWLTVPFIPFHTKKFKRFNKKTTS